MSTPRTTRLDGELPVRAHAREMSAWDADPRFAATMGGAHDRAWVEDLLDRLAREHADDGVSLWVWRERATGAVVARGGLRRVRFDGDPVVEVAWAVDPDRWGEGFAAELGRASVEHGFGALGLDAIWARTLHDNVRSRRVMERLGFRYDRDIVHAGLPHVAYRLVGP